MDRWNTFFNAPYCTEYDEDILETLKECERNRMSLMYDSPQLQHRRATVQIILNVSDQQSYRRATVHLAIHLLDMFMSGHTIVEQRLNLVALTCLYLACKIEENEPLVPSPTRLNGFVSNMYQPADFIALEVAILRFFDWHITIPTASTFLDIFTMHCFSREDCVAMVSPGGSSSSEPFMQRIDEVSSTLLESSLMYLDLCTITPSLLAASCVAAARCLTPGVPIWSEQLIQLTGYEYREMHETCQKLLFVAMPQSPSSTLSSTPKRSISDAGYLSEMWETDEDETSGSDTSSCSSGSSDSSDSSSSISSISTIRCKNSRDSGTVLSDTGESEAKKRRITFPE